MLSRIRVLYKKFPRSAIFVKIAPVTVNSTKGHDEFLHALSVFLPISAQFAAECRHQFRVSCPQRPLCTRSAHSAAECRASVAVGGNDITLLVCRKERLGQVCALRYGAQHTLQSCYVDKQAGFFSVYHVTTVRSVCPPHI